MIFYLPLPHYEDFLETVAVRQAARKIRDPIFFLHDVLCRFQRDEFRVGDAHIEYPFRAVGQHARDRNAGVRVHGRLSGRRSELFHIQTVRSGARHEDGACRHRSSVDVERPVEQPVPLSGAVHGRKAAYQLGAKDARRYVRQGDVAQRRLFLEREEGRYNLQVLGRRADGRPDRAPCPWCPGSRSW